MKAFAYLVFPNSINSILPEGSSQAKSEQMYDGIITSVTHGGMSGIPLSFSLQIYQGKWDTFCPVLSMPISRSILVKTMGYKIIQFCVASIPDFSIPPNWT